jgi:hypothetical protein
MRLSSLGGCGLALASESRKISSQPATYPPLSYSDRYSTPKLGEQAPIVLALNKIVDCPTTPPFASILLFLLSVSIYNMTPVSNHQTFIFRHFGS